MYLNDKRFTIRTKEKKDGVDWIVDLKFTKKWKGKWEKKDGFCRVVDLNLQRNKRIWTHCCSQPVEEIRRHHPPILRCTAPLWSRTCYKNRRKKIGLETNPPIKICNRWSIFQWKTKSSRNHSYSVHCILANSCSKTKY